MTRINDMGEFCIVEQPSRFVKELMRGNRESEASVRKCKRCGRPCDGDRNGYCSDECFEASFGEWLEERGLSWKR